MMRKTNKGMILCVTALFIASIAYSQTRYLNGNLLVDASPSDHFKKIADTYPKKTALCLFNKNGINGFNLITHYTPDKTPEICQIDLRSIVKPRRLLPPYQVILLSWFPGKENSIHFTITAKPQNDIWCNQHETEKTCQEDSVFYGKYPSLNDTEWVYHFKFPYQKKYTTVLFLPGQETLLTIKTLKKPEYNILCTFWTVTDDELTIPHHIHLLSINEIIQSMEIECQDQHLELDQNSDNANMPTFPSKTECKPAENINWSWGDNP